MRILSVENVAELVERRGVRNCLDELSRQLKSDFIRWKEFTKMPRPAMHVPGGVIELMPVCDNEYYAFKYVNGHPQNPDLGKQTVMATGQLSRVSDGEPLLYCEMTVLTALRTAATAALATDQLAREDATTMAIIGTGAQSEFQVQAMCLVRPITTVQYYDTDPKAMRKFARNLRHLDLELVAAPDTATAVEGADIVTVCTASKAHAEVVRVEWVEPGMHLNALGGDCPGKTELSTAILQRAKVVVEYFEQSYIEGEIQQVRSKTKARQLVHAELYQLETGERVGRESDTEVTVFDSVGFALEDYSALRWIYDLAERFEIGEERELIPATDDPKDLFGVFNREGAPLSSPLQFG